MISSESSTSADPKADILMMCWNFPPAVGGIESVAFHLWQELRKKERAVKVIARFGPEREEGIHRPHSAGLFRYLMFALCKGVKLLRHHQVEVIICPGIVDAPVAWLFSKWFGVPFVLLAHGTDLVREGWMYRCSTRRLFRAANAVAANSKNTQELLKQIGVAPERIEVIHPGALPPETSDQNDVLPEVRSILQKKPGGLILMTVGRVIRRKGIGEFIQSALPGILELHPDVHYIVVGKDASDSLVHHEKLLDQLKELSHEKGLEGHITFTGSVSEVALHQLIGGADLLVFPVIPVPGDVEGFGIVVLEGAIHGVPTVASRLGGIPDAVAEGKTGKLVEPENWGEMIEVISELLSDAPTRQRMGERAAHRATSEFSWQVIGEQYASLVERVIHQGSPDA